MSPTSSAISACDRPIGMTSEAFGFVRPGRQSAQGRFRRGSDGRLVWRGGRGARGRSELTLTARGVVADRPFVVLAWDDFRAEPPTGPPGWSLRPGFSAVDGPRLQYFEPDGQRRFVRLAEGRGEVAVSESLAALCAFAHDRPDARPGLDDPAATQRLMAALGGVAPGPAPGPGDGSVISRALAVAVAAELVARGIATYRGRPLDDAIADPQAFVASVVAHVADRFTSIAEEVAWQAVRDALVGPWPFGVLSDAAGAPPMPPAPPVPPVPPQPPVTPA